jgi:hypothetical protein
VTQNEHALEYAHASLKNDEEFLYEVDQIHDIEIYSDIFYFASKRIQDKIKGNQDYLLDFGPVYLKPAKK